MDYLRMLDIDLDMFFIIQGQEDCKHMKPDPRVFIPALTILEEEGIIPEEVVYVGDTVDHDLEPTLQYHPQIPFVGMVSGAADKEDFLEAGILKECIIDSPEKIFRAIDFLKNK